MANARGSIDRRYVGWAIRELAVISCYMGVLLAFTARQFMISLWLPKGQQGQS